MTAPHRAKKSLGQNFLTDPAIQQRIVNALDPQPTDVVVEIGPGQGALTAHLAGRVQHLVLIELDDLLAAALHQHYAAREDVTVIHADFLNVNLCDVIPRTSSFKVIGNIPYNITTPIIFKLLERACRPSMIVLMVQREVADRVTSPQGSKTYGALSVGVQSLADVSKLFIVGRGSFRPAPNVDSAVMRIIPHEPPRLSDREENDLRTLTRTAFGWRRKQLQKILRSAPNYEATPEVIHELQSDTGIGMETRPETVSPEKFIHLARALRKHSLPHASESGKDNAMDWE
jgi:16S rRNA (adenine1518-N6/adenine1519-N6)-dimethyltransferase